VRIRKQLVNTATIRGKTSLTFATVPHYRSTDSLLPVWELSGREHYLHSSKSWLSMNAMNAEVKAREEREFLLRVEVEALPSSPQLR
jgi:carbon starvation protein CstA